MNFALNPLPPILEVPMCFVGGYMDNVLMKVFIDGTRQCTGLTVNGACDGCNLFLYRPVTGHKSSTLYISAAVRVQ